MLIRVNRIREKLRREGLEGFLVASNVNRNYLSGFTGSAGLALVTLKKAYFLTDSRYQTQASGELKGFDLVIQTRALWEDAVRLIRKAGAKTLGFEAAHVTVGIHEFLKSRLGRTVLKPTRQWVEDARLLKDKGEAALIRQAARITDHAFSHILSLIKPGARERDLAAELEFHMKRQGASGPAFETIVASGFRGALPHGVASEKRIALGEMVVMDFGCVYEGYCSDMTRTVSVGRPSPLARRVYRVVLEAQQRGLQAVKPGRQCRQADKPARGLIARAGYGRFFGHGLGHGVGREVHEDPRLGPGVKTVLKPGMVVTVEPGVYLPGKLGVRIEDLVLVTEDGCEVLSQSRKDLIIL